MKYLLSLLRTKARVLLQEDGQDLIEYALIAALISTAAAATIGPFGLAISSAWTSIATRIGTSLS